MYSSFFMFKYSCLVFKEHRSVFFTLRNIFLLFNQAFRTFCQDWLIYQFSTMSCWNVGLYHVQNDSLYRAVYYNSDHQYILKRALVQIQSSYRVHIYSCSNLMCLIDVSRKFFFQRPFLIRTSPGLLDFIIQILIQTTSFNFKK